jgi:hypothetical protein
MKRKFGSFSMKAGLWLSVAAILTSASNSAFTPPPSDSFASAPTIPPMTTDNDFITSVPVDITTFGSSEAQDKPLVECGRNAGNHSAWYKYVAPSSPGLQSITIDTLASAADLDTMIGVYLVSNTNGTPGDPTDDTLTEISCDDQSGTDIDGIKSITHVALTANQTYYIVGSSFNGATGNPCDPCDPGGLLSLTVKYNHQLTGSPPSTSSAVRVDPDNTTSDFVNYTVTFTQSVTGVDVFDFGLITNGITNARVQEVTGSGTTYNVKVYTGIGKGTLTLNVRHNGSVVNSILYPLQEGYTGETYTIVRNVLFLPLLMR